MKHEEFQRNKLNLASVRKTCFSLVRHVNYVDVPWGVQRTDLVVHDGAQAHDADVDIVFLTDQSRVFQCSPAGQCVTTEKYGKRDKK